MLGPGFALRLATLLLACVTGFALRTGFLHNFVRCLRCRGVAMAVTVSAARAAFGTVAGPYPVVCRPWLITRLISVVLWRG